MNSRRSGVKPLAYHVSKPQTFILQSQLCRSIESPVAQLASAFDCYEPCVKSMVLRNREVPSSSLGGGERCILFGCSFACVILCFQDLGIHRLGPFRLFFCVCGSLFSRPWDTIHTQTRTFSFLFFFPFLSFLRILEYLRQAICSGSGSRLVKGTTCPVKVPIRLACVTPSTQTGLCSAPSGSHD